MRCGEKCFYVKTEIDGKEQIHPVNARTSVEARKTLRKEFGPKTTILAVKQSKINR